MTPALPMTPMSHIAARPAPANPRNQRESRHSVGLARHLLSLRSMIGALTLAFAAPLLGGCPIPFPSEVVSEADAGINAVPVIQRATPADLAFPGPLILERGDARIVTLHIKDLDVDDTLYVRMFRDYDVLAPTPFVNDVEIPVTGEVERLRDVALATWCAGLDPTDNEFHFLVAMVADRAFLDCGVQPDECVDQPLFRELPASAEWSTVSWTIKCDPAS